MGGLSGTSFATTASAQHTPNCRTWRNGELSTHGFANRYGSRVSAVAASADPKRQKVQDGDLTRGSPVTTCGPGDWIWRLNVFADP